jgi:periplasmic divalent cation tolerance protein
MPERSDVVVVLVTAPDNAAADRLARALVEERLIACANLVPRLRSIYRWEGEVEESDEVLLLLKARRADVDAIAVRVQELHPYDVPEVVAVDVVAGLEPYLEWVNTETDRRG